MTSDNSIARIKERIVVSDVLARYGSGPYRRTAKGSAGPCPICSNGKNKRSRAFTISRDDRAWYCFGTCRRGGSVIDLVMALEHCSLKEACERLQRW
jgi:DNA primase